MIAILPVVVAMLLFYSQCALASYGSKVCKEPGYRCYVVKKGDTWTKLFPDAGERDVVMRINRVNISLYRGMKIAIPTDLHSDKLAYAPFARQIDATGQKTIVVSLKKLAFGAYDEDGNLEYWGPVSGGQSYCSDVGRGCRTATGQFAIYQKGGAGCKSSKYPVGRGGAPMPYCMFFHKGFALHGSATVPGYNASHGCVRMYTNDAKWLNQEFTAGEKSVPVVVNF